MKKPSIPLRERKKDATRHALLAAANKRFHQNGYETTTIDEVCQDVGVSRRTFFRYFPDKESLAFPHRRERLERFVELLGSAPASEGPVAGLRRISQMFAKEYMQNRDRLVAQQRLVQAAPALLARENEIDRDWENGMSLAFRARAGGGPEGELRARVLAGAAIGVIRATMRHWFASDGKDDLAQLGDEALDYLERGWRGH
ncbi:MAG TPA: TetR family transcriptional regulator [Xanthomonadaceae bacterium]|jgi:AcrR family transcriptional regulator|nr:TetR family transcriptional regulator [Xanthomonadaceae bacterium]